MTDLDYRLLFWFGVFVSTMFAVALIADRLSLRRKRQKEKDDEAH